MSRRPTPRAPVRPTGGVRRGDGGGKRPTDGGTPPAAAMGAARPGFGLAALLNDGVQLHRQGRLAEAAACYGEVLARDPAQADALHLAGLIAHQQGEQGDALALIERACRLRPHAASFHNSRGVVMLAQDRPVDAEAAFAAALTLDPMYPEAANNLGNALTRQHRFEEAIAAYDRALEPRGLYVEALSNRGRALHLAGRAPDAVASFRRALELRPKQAKTLRYLGDALAGAGAREDAEAAYREAIALEPGSAEAHAGLASLLERAGRMQDALAEAEAALRLDSNDARALVAAARCERRLGKPAAALARLEHADLAGADAEAAALAQFERAQLLDKLARYPEAYAAFVAGNETLARTPAARRVDRDFFPEIIARAERTFTEAWVAGWTATAPATRAIPIFLIGFPRSGTTLLDQILDSHPALRTMEEKNALDVARAAVGKRPEDYPGALAHLGTQELAHLRTLYFAQLDRHLADLGGRTPVDKMPLNSIDAGLIYRLFPEAKVLLALRHPCDVVLSGFMQALQPNAAMVHFESLAATARFYAQVMGLWLHYHAVLPLAVHTVRYEDLVVDFPGETRRILDFLGLPWDDAVLAYAQHASARSIATPSYHQVVQPIYSGSVGRWRNYAFAFDEVLPILAPFIEAFGYAGGD